MRRRLGTALGLALALSAVCGVLPAAAPAAEWHSEQPLTAGSAVPVPIGQVYDIEFWAPNRGLLITADGLWAYDGTGWSRLSTVCGGVEGRIAWAGPLDFWTISDQPLGQALTGALHSISLCHFVNGTVVASYAEPAGLATSYLPMSAAACLAPNDCWFAGEVLPGQLNTGAFHLHWDGLSLTPVPSLTRLEPDLRDPERPIGHIAVHEGKIYESVRIEPGPIPGETLTQPALLHRIASDPPSFKSVLPSKPFDYGAVPPSERDGFRLSSDGTSLWGIGSTPFVAFRLQKGVLSQVPLNDPGNLLNAETFDRALAAEPGAEAAWVGYIPQVDRGNLASGFARLALLHADGTVDHETLLPGASEGIARKGPVAALACPGPGQCWMATERGWLFHLGGNLPRDEAAAMHQLITYRPPDGATPGLPLDTLPIDDSGAEPAPEEAADARSKRPRKRPRQRPLVAKVHQRLISETVLELSFTLTAKARVQLLAKRDGSVVARTKLAVLGRGKHELRLRLDPKRWPTKFDFRAKPAGKRQ